jgi:hypothetical protein
MQKPYNPENFNITLLEWGLNPPPPKKKKVQADPDFIHNLFLKMCMKVEQHTCMLQRWFQSRCLNVHNNPYL